MGSMGGTAFIGYNASSTSTAGKEATTTTIPVLAM